MSMLAGGGERRAAAWPGQSPSITTMDATNDARQPALEMFTGRMV
jgi:hypothetical protein